MGEGWTRDKDRVKIKQAKGITERGKTKGKKKGEKEKEEELQPG